MSYVRGQERGNPFYLWYLSRPVVRGFIRLNFIIPSQQSWRGYSNAAVRGWLGEWVGECVRGWVRGSVPLYLVDTLATTVFAQSISNFTCTFALMRGGSLLILGKGVKGQGQLWHSVHKTLWTR